MNIVARNAEAADSDPARPTSPPLDALEDDSDTENPPKETP